MVRRIKFGLKMPGKSDIGSLEELREYFDLESIVEYYFNGKLVKWLNSREYFEEAEQLEQLDNSKPEFKESLCKIFAVEYAAQANNDIAVKDIAQTVEKRNLLKHFTDDEAILENVDKVAFNQAELRGLLDGDEKQTIYLCGERFTIPLGKKNKTYIGFNNPKVEVLPVTMEDLEARGIKVEKLTLIGIYEKDK